MSKNSGFKNSNPTLYKSLFTTKFFHGLILPSRKTDINGFTSDSMTGGILHLRHKCL